MNAQVTLYVNLLQIFYLLFNFQSPFQSFIQMSTPRIEIFNLWSQNLQKQCLILLQHNGICNKYLKKIHTIKN